MDHQLAIKTNTIDKYLLDELSPEERSEFEEHMFDCSECAAQMKQDLAMMASLKEVLGEAATSGETTKAGWRQWFQPLTFAPLLTAAALAMVVGYQNLVSIPGMLEPQVLESRPISAVTRGQAGQIAVRKGAAMFGVAFDVMARQAYPAYVCEFTAASAPALTIMDCGKHNASEFTLSLLLPAAKFPPGEYTMILRPAPDRQTEVGRYVFAIRNQDN